MKIPQLAVRDSTGEEIPGYFNIWRYILEKLTPAERGPARGNPKPEAILKWANPPISMLAANWKELYEQWRSNRDDPRPPVFILVCKNTKIAKMLFEWIAEDKPPAGIPSFGVAAFRNGPDLSVTIRVDSKVVHETDSSQAKTDESAGCGSPWTPSAKCSGLKTLLAARYILKDLRSSPKSSTARFTRRAAIFAASSALAC